MKARRLGQWATRVYIVSFTAGIGILALYTIVQPHTLTKVFDRPPFSLYNQLIEKYGHNLECPCSMIASTYNHFVEIEAKFHEVRRHCSNQLERELHKSRYKLYFRKQWFYHKNK
jgi:hypothetical protein